MVTKKQDIKDKNIP